MEQPSIFGQMEQGLRFERFFRKLCLLSEFKDTLKNIQQTSHGSCDPLLLAASWKMRLAESELPLEWKLPGWYPQQVPEDREMERMD